MKECPKRKTNRLKDYDYSQNGAYFITICAYNRKHLFGSITNVGADDPVRPNGIFVGDAALGVPIIKLSRAGEIVKQHIENINDISKGICLDKYVIMPNHIHFIVSIITENGTPKAASPTKAIIPQIVNALKSLTSKKLSESIWQRSYYDHIIRSEFEYQKIWEYIDTNPLQWGSDEYFNL